jgi:hypothetical protein
MYYTALFDLKIIFKNNQPVNQHRLQAMGHLKMVQLDEGHIQLDSSKSLRFFARQHVQDKQV